MTKKPIIDGVKKNEIVAAALDLFFEHGYENTSIRLIQKEVNSSVGLFYRYYRSKDDVFEAAIKLFFEKYEKSMKEIIESNQHMILTKYIDYIDFSTQEFREKYLIKLHWSILGAIREYTIQIMRKYIFQILEMYIKEGTIDRDINITVASNTIAFAVGGSILYQDKETYEGQKKDIFTTISTILNINDF